MTKIILTLLDRIISKFAQLLLNDPIKGTKGANFKIFHCRHRANWVQLYTPDLEEQNKSENTSNLNISQELGILVPPLTAFTCINMSTTCTVMCCCLTWAIRSCKCHFSPKVILIQKSFWYKSLLLSLPHFPL